MTTRFLASCAAVFVSGCAAVLPVFGYPPHALRSEPPTAAVTRALAVGVKAPDFALDDFSLRKASERGPVMLVFYRGDW